MSSDPISDYATAHPFLIEESARISTQLLLYEYGAVLCKTRLGDL
jgi:hypothetical protein